MNRLLPLMIALMATGCFDAPVSKTAIAGTEQIEHGTVSCSKGPGYCMACALGLDGEFNCAPGFKYNCPGTQQVTRRFWDVDVRYESGKERRATDSEIISRDSACI